MMPEPKRQSPFSLVLVAVLAAFGLAAGAAVLLSGAPAAPAVEPTPAAVSLPDNAQVINARMIDFTLQTLDGRTLSLSDYAGRVVFLNFWATWCGPCEREIPALQAFARRELREPNGAVVLAVNLEEDADTVRAFLAAREITSLTVLMDSAGEVSDSYGVFNLPVTFVIDRDGIVRYPKYGEITVADMDAYLAALDEASG